MHKGDYHTDYSKYYDKEYKEKDLAFEHVKELKHKLREQTKPKDTSETTKTIMFRKKSIKRVVRKEGEE